MDIIQDTVKEKLILQGITELENHGINGFSLRRVASACSVSCAAPYKHFKNKDEFIFEISKYIYTQWHLLATQIMDIFKEDIKKQITEMCVSYIKFWMANPKFRSVLMINTDEAFGKRAGEIRELAQITKHLTENLCKEKNLSDEKTKQIIISLRAAVYGAIMMMNKGEIENDSETIDVIRNTIQEILSAI